MRAVLFVGLLATLSVGCAGSPTATAPPAPAVPAAPVAVLSVRTGGPADLAIGGFSPLTFDASASTGDNLQFAIDFGDGATATAAVSTHLAARSTRADGERRTARLTVTDRLGRSHSVRHDYFVVNLGADSPWFTTPQVHALKLTVDGQALTGWHTAPENGFDGDVRRSRRLAGRVTGHHELEVSTEDGYFSFVGSVVWAMPPTPGAGPGGLYQENVRLRLTVRGGLHDGQTFDFRWTDPY